MNEVVCGIRMVGVRSMKDQWAETRRDFGKALAGLMIGGKAPAWAEKGPRVPVLVELFTSEGCSSCPPADRLLERLHREQPVAGADVIVLSEHVDYWNYIGWKDPFSSPTFSARQQEYARRFRIDSVYTPQMVVDGLSQFVGSDSRAAESVIREAARKGKASFSIGDAGGKVELGLAPSPDRMRIFVAKVKDEGLSKVTRGENSGRELRHVRVATELKEIGRTEPDREWTGSVEKWSAVAFAQRVSDGRIMAVTRLVGS
jgi:hypothetical protein